MRFRASDRPRASVVVLVRRNAPALERCLEALAARGLRNVEAEVILVANDAEPQVLAVVEDTRGARVVRTAVNHGFGGANNLGAAAARGEFVVFLNDDTEVGDRWLDALVRVATRFPAAGAVGSRVTFPDGSLQEAGSIVWRDGSTMNVGRDLARGVDAFAAVREVDYCSACSLLLRRATFEAVGGFSEEYFPIYYEDTDLCLKVRALGQMVLYAPASHVMHHESLSSRDRHFKEFIFLRNRARFRRQWTDYLEGCVAPAPDSPAAVARAIELARRSRPQVLVVDDRVPRTHLGSGFGRMRLALEELSEHCWVTFVATDERAAADPDLADLGIEISTDDVQQALSRPERVYDAVVVSRPHNFQRAGAAIRRHQPQAALVYDAEALFHVREFREAAYAPAADRRALEARAKATQRLERAIARQADAIVSLSPEEAGFFRNCGAAAVHVIHPTRPWLPLTPARLADRRHLGLVAGWLGGDTSPNAEALRWFAREVLPMVRRAVPGVRLLVTGANPPASVRGLAGVDLIGHQVDLAAFYDRIRAAVAPVVFGAGVKTKSVEAILAGVPLVGTSQGLEGICGLEPGAATVADDPAAFAAALVDLLTSDARWAVARDACETSARRWSEAAPASWAGVMRSALLNRRVDHRHAGGIRSSNAEPVNPATARGSWER